MLHEVQTFNLTIKLTSKIEKIQDFPKNFKDSIDDIENYSETEFLGTEAYQKTQPRPYS